MVLRPFREERPSISVRPSRVRPERMCGGGGEIPSVLCGRANNLRGARANIRHSSRGHGGPRQLWLEVRFQRLRRERRWIKTISSFSLRRWGKAAYSRLAGEPEGPGCEGWRFRLA